MYFLFDEPGEALVLSKSFVSALDLTTVARIFEWEVVYILVVIKFLLYFLYPLAIGFGSRVWSAGVTAFTNIVGGSFNT